MFLFFHCNKNTGYKKQKKCTKIYNNIPCGGPARLVCAGTERVRYQAWVDLPSGGEKSRITSVIEGGISGPKLKTNKQTNILNKR